MQKGKAHFIADGYWGSSSKGAVSTRLADIFKIPNLSSCNFQNAGHYSQFGNDRFLFKALPTGSILRKTRNRDDITSWIGPNSGFFMDQLKKELEWTNSIMGDSVKIHDRAVISTQRHADMEAPGGKDSTAHVASTMSGAGAAYAEKVMRKLTTELVPFGMKNWDFYENLWAELNDGRSLLHEVSQGFALSLNAGTHFPTCTFRDATPQQAMADLGLKPNQVGEVYLNLRTFPIRVGDFYDSSGNKVGNSGDFMPDCEETSWEQIGKDAEMPDEEIKKLYTAEKTSVTLRLRRVCTHSWKLLEFASKFCGATKLCLNFTQYLHYSSYRLKGGHEMLNILHPKVRSFIDKCEDVTGLKVCLLGTGPEHEEYIWLGD